MFRADSLAARVISLPSSLERRQAVTENLRDCGLPWEFFDGLTADADCGLTVSPRRQISHYGRLLNRGEVGCFKSHLGVLRVFDQRPRLQWLLVLEDDVWIDTGFPFLETMTVLDHRKIAYLRLFARQYKPADIVLQLGPRQLIRFRTDPYGAQAYLINRIGAERFVRSLHSIDRPIDDELGRFWRHGLDPYGIFPFPAVERSTESSLEEGRNANPMKISAFTLRRHVIGVFEKLLKMKANAGFRIAKRWARN